MTDLSPTAKHALAALRARDALGPAAKSRVRARIDTSIGGAKLDARAIAIRLALPVAIAAAVLLGLWAVAPRRGVTRADREPDGQAAYGAEPRADEATAGRRAAGRTERAGDREPAPHTTGTDETAGSTATSLPLEGERPVRSARRAPADRDAPEASLPVVATDTTLAEEMRLLRRARAAMRDHDAMRALEALEAHAKSFAHGQMSEDRAALYVEALCAADRREDARGAASAFAQAWPRSPHRARVQKICADP